MHKIEGIQIKKTRIFTLRVGKADIMDHGSKSPPVFDKKFFASANSSQGFQNEFPRCLGSDSGIDLLYIIKGGPGTGKSHLLRTVGRAAEAHGYATTYYCCSSDPTSLDGLRIEKEGRPTWGFVDGTAPHVWEPTLPGVKEEMINLGIFWHGDILRSRKEEIKKWDDLKDACYRLTYRDLAAAGATFSAADMLVAPCIKEDKLLGLAERLSRLFGAGESFSETPAHMWGIGMKGCVRFDTYEKMADKAGGEIICVDFCYGLGYRLTEAVYARLKKKGARVLVSRDPVNHDKIDGIYDLTKGTCCIVGLGNCPYPHRRIFLRRYLDSEAFKSVRGEVRHRLRLSEEMKNCAAESMKKAGTYHFILEKTYAEAMDFAAKDRFDKAFCSRLFD